MTENTTASGAADLIRKLLNQIEDNTCEHTSTHRGGAIWEICDDCDAKWADDRGGKPVFVWPKCVEEAHAFLLAASAPVAPTQPLTHLEAQALAVLEMLVGANALQSLSVHEGEDAMGRVKGTWGVKAQAEAVALRGRLAAVAATSPEAAPVAPAPQPAPEGFVLVPVEPTPEMVNAAYSGPMQGGLEAVYANMLAAAPKAAPTELPDAVSHYGGVFTDEQLGMKPAAPQQGEYPESLTKAVDQWFSQNTGVGGCSDKDVSDLASLFYGVVYQGGRESVDDALAVVESFGPGVQGLNDTFARQVLLGQEVRRLRAAYEQACQGRNDFRNLYRAARGAAQAAPAYKDSTPQLNVGYSSFEDWYQNYLPNSVGHKQIARDAYAAGMGDPLVTAQPAPVAEDASLTQAARDVLAERQRQINAEGWTSDHDDGFRKGELAYAATAYAIEAAHLADGMQASPTRSPPFSWPWDAGWWKPSDTPRRNLLKSAALVLAEIERIDRAKAAQPEGGAK